MTHSRVKSLGVARTMPCWQCEDEAKGAFETVQQSEFEITWYKKKGVEKKRVGSQKNHCNPQRADQGNISYEEPQTNLLLHSSSRRGQPPFTVVQPPGTPSRSTL